jgi:hypothetical protein
VRRQSVEVVDREQHVADPIVLVEAKCRKAYPADYCLLVAGRSGETVYPQVIARDIRKITVPPSDSSFSLVRFILHSFKFRFAHKMRLNQ